MSPRLRFTPSRPMAPEFQFISQKHVEPILCLNRGEASYLLPLYQPIALPDRPRVPQKTPDPDVSAFVPSFAGRICDMCKEPFSPKAGNQVYCFDCGLIRRQSPVRKRKAATRLTTTVKRGSKAA